MFLSKIQKNLNFKGISTSAARLNKQIKIKSLQNDTKIGENVTIKVDIIIYC